MDKVSLIVPVYNVDKYLEECLDSLINQSYDNIEIILINDGSTDNSGNICDKYSNKYSKVKTFHKENAGLSSARNMGIEKSIGDYLFFVDSDDFIHPETIKIMCGLMIKENCDIVQCDFFKFHDKDSINFEPVTTTVKHECYDGLTAVKSIYSEKSIEATIVCNKMYKRKLFDKVRFPIGKRNEDEFTTYKLLYESKKVIYIYEKFYYYRQRENSIMHSKIDINRLDYLEALEERMKFFLDNNDCTMYKKTLIQYVESARDICIKFIEQGVFEEQVSMLLTKYNSTMNLLIKDSSVPFKKKILMKFFANNPKLYINIRKMLKKKKSA